MVCGTLPIGEMWVRLAGEAMLWLVVLVGVLSLAAVLVWHLRRRVVEPDRHRPAGPALSIEDVRRLHAGGAMSTTEFHVVREVVVGQSMAEVLKGREGGSVEPPEEQTPAQGEQKRTEILPTPPTGQGHTAESD